MLFWRLFKYGGEHYENFMWGWLGMCEKYAGAAGGTSLICAIKGYGL
jgi:hypothetical protein